jgi:hypothetical protein
MEVSRAIIVTTPHYSTIQLLFDQRVETTRRGPADLPERFVAALTAAGVDLRTQDLHPQQGQRPVRYRRRRAWRDLGR